MLVIKNTISELRRALKAERAQGKTIGFVPTMGYLHEGHLTLMREAKKRADIAVASIFVNPTQFGPNEDLDKYPRNLERDQSLAAGVGVDYMFVPTTAEMYPEDYSTYVDVEGITEGLCGKSRPGHFKGVATVVTKLFNIVQPDIAFFGQKDWQQLAAIKRMARDLNIDIEIVGVPTVREADGLAMSSRNTYLTPEQRAAALVLSQSLGLAGEMAGAGERDVTAIARAMQESIAGQPLVELEYLEIVHPENLTPVDTITGDTLIAIAARVGMTRLIDNTVISPDLEK